MSELGGGWRIGHAQPGGDLKGPSGLLLRLSGIDPAVDRGQDELSGFIRLQDTEVGDDGRRATAAQTGRLALRTAAKETGRSAEVDLNGEATALVRGDQVGPIGPGGDLHTPARTRQAYLRVGVVANDRGIDISVLVDLRASHEPDRDEPALQIKSEYLVHRTYRQGSRDERRISDR